MSDPPLDTVDRHPVAAYFTLTVALSWGVWLPILSAVEGPMLRLAAIPGAFGPFAAAAVVTKLRGDSVRAWLASTLDWRRSPRWYAAALAVPIGVSVALGTAVVPLAGGIEAGSLGPALATFAINVVFASLLGGGQEEFGWRGFALPHLQRSYGALTASVIVGAVWGLWHAPMFAFGVYPMSPVGYAAFVIAASVVFTWLYNGSRGCVPAAILMHGALNASVNVPLQVVGGPSALPVPFSPLLAAAFGLLALGLVARYGPATIAAGAARTPTWAADRPEQRSTADATGGGGVSTVRRAVPEATSLALVLATVAISVVFAPALPERMVVGWHVGLDGAGSVTRGPRLLGLVALPAISVGTYAALRITRLVIDGDDGVDSRLFEVLAHLVLGAFALGQAWVLAANL